MALTDGNNGIDATMLVSPYAGVPAYNGGFGGGMFGGSNDWLGLLFLINIKYQEVNIFLSSFLKFRTFSQILVQIFVYFFIKFSDIKLLTYQDL